MEVYNCSMLHIRRTYYLCIHAMVQVSWSLPNRQIWVTKLYIYANHISMSSIYACYVKLSPFQVKLTLGYADGSCTSCVKYNTVKIAYIGQQRPKNIN